MEPIRTLVVDDEPIARHALRALLAGDREVALVGECATGREAVESIRSVRPDLVFLDVQMPEMDGFGVIRAIGVERMPVVVFVTAWDRYALRAFEARALDYLVKPFDDERFRVALARAKDTARRGLLEELSRRLLDVLEPAAPDARRAEPDGAPRRRSGRWFERVAIRSGGRLVFLRADEIDWIEASDDHVRLHVGPRGFLVRGTMGGFEKRLDPARFVRIHRSTIVNLRRIKELRPQFHGEYAVVLQDGTELKLSRTHRAGLESRIGL